MGKGLGPHLAPILILISLMRKSTRSRAGLCIKQFRKGDEVMSQHQPDLKDGLRSRTSSRREILIEFERKEMSSLPTICSPLVCFPAFLPSSKNALSRSRVGMEKSEGSFNKMRNDEIKVKDALRDRSPYYLHFTDGETKG